MFNCKMANVNISSLHFMYESENEADARLAVLEIWLNNYVGNISPCISVIIGSWVMPF